MFLIVGGLLFLFLIVASCLVFVVLCLLSFVWFVVFVVRCLFFGVLCVFLV